MTHAELDDQDVHERALAMAEAAFDNPTDRLVLLQAAAMLKAALALGEADPITAAAHLLNDHVTATMDFTQMALALTARPRLVPTEGQGSANTLLNADFTEQGRTQ